MILRTGKLLRTIAVFGCACVALFAAVACGGDGPTEPVEAADSMSFSYSGAESGSFAVSGPIGPSQEGAAAIKLAGPRNVLIVAGVRMTSATHGDFLELWLPDISAPGSLSLDFSECTSPTLNCPLAFFGTNVSTEDPTLDPDFDSEEGFYFFSSGTVTVTFVSATRIAGTFAGSAESLTLEGPTRTVTVTNGKFDVSITSSPEL